jgi:ABC-type amino acid transport substrate-binding protein
MNDNGQFSGISIFLWEKIAEQLGLDCSIEQYRLEEMLEAVAQGKADIAILCFGRNLKYLQRQLIADKPQIEISKMISAKN